MATIRPLQMAPVNFGDSNALTQAAQRLLLGGAQGITDAFGDYRQAVVDRNTANAINLLTGATSRDDLTQRQGQVANILAAAGGDINNEAVQRVQQTLPDTLINRELNQNRLTQFEDQQHDTPLLNQAMSLMAAGDMAGGRNLLSQVRGDASSALTFGAGREDAAAKLALERQQLGIQAAGLRLRQQAATDRATQASRMNTQLQTLLKQALGDSTAASQASTQAGAKEANARLTDAEKNNPLNNPKADTATTVKTLDDQYNHWWLPSSNRGTTLMRMIDQLDPDNSLNASQRNNLLGIMNTAFENAPSNSNPDLAAMTRGREVIDELGRTQTQRLENTQSVINQRLASQRARTVLLLQNLLGNSNGSTNPLLLQQLIQPDQEE